MDLNSILVVDDSSVDLEIVSIACSSLDCEVVALKDPIEALESYKATQHSIVLTDYQMEPMNGLELITEIKKVNPTAVCLIMTGYLDARVIDYVQEMELTHIITKPIRPTHLMEQLRVAFHQHLGATHQLGEIVMSNRMDKCVALLGQSREICLVRKQVSKFIKIQRPLFVEGPFGIGKPDVIKFIHDSGAYANSQIVICPCQEMTQAELEVNLISAKGEWGDYIRKAKHGTLVINHIESIPLELQSALAKNMDAISEQCRIISWANGSIDDLLDEGKVDTELYFKLTLDTIHLPALSERPVDVEEVVRFVAASPDSFEMDYKMQPTEVDLLVAELRRCELPGNLRELIARVREASFHCKQAKSVVSL